MDKITYSQVPIATRRWHLLRTAPDGQHAQSTYADDPEPIHLMFGLTYANYLCLPRALLQSMPRDWQQAFCDLLDDLHDAYRGLDWPRYDVRAMNSPGKYIRDPMPHYDRGRTRVPYNQKNAL